MVPLIQGSEPARRTHLNGLEGEQSSSKHRLLVTFVPLKPLKVPVLMYVLNVGDERSFNSSYLEQCLVFIVTIFRPLAKHEFIVLPPSLI